MVETVPKQPRDLPTASGSDVKKNQKVKKEEPKSKKGKSYQLPAGKQCQSMGMMRDIPPVCEEVYQQENTEMLKILQEMREETSATLQVMTAQLDGVREENRRLREEQDLLKNADRLEREFSPMQGSDHEDPDPVKKEDSKKEDRKVRKEPVEDKKSSTQSNRKKNKKKPDDGNDSGTKSQKPTGIRPRQPKVS